MRKIIDIHTHTFPAKIACSAIEKLSAASHTRAFSDGTIDGLISSMNEAGISLSVLQPVATKSEQVTHINDGAIRINEDYKISSLIHQHKQVEHDVAIKINAQEKIAFSSFRIKQAAFDDGAIKHVSIISFGAIHPDFDDYNSELARIFKAGIKGIKLHPVYQGVKIDDERYVKILARAAELGLIVMLHAGFDIGFPGNDYASPSRILRALKSAGNNVKIILAHMGGWRCWQEAQDLFAGMKIYIDTAFSLGEFIPNGDNYYSSRQECMMLSDENFVNIIKAFGAEKVLFGTDSPWSCQNESVKKFLGLPGLSEREKNLIMYNNSVNLLRIGEYF